jgi:hypothetical protein
MFRLPSPSFAISITALVISLGGAGYSATGGNFILGATNSATSLTKLNASIANAALSLSNQTNAAGATGLSITTAGDRPPLVVNSEVKVARLNADSLDGINSTEFSRVIGIGTQSTSGTLTAGDKSFFAGPFTHLCRASVSSPSRRRLAGARPPM